MIRFGNDDANKMEMGKVEKTRSDTHLDCSVSGSVMIGKAAKPVEDGLIALAIYRHSESLTVIEGDASSCQASI